VETAVYNKAAAAANACIAAKAGYYVRLHGAQLAGAGAVNITIEDTDGTDLLGLCALVANGDLKLILPPCGIPYAESPEDKGINILHSGAVQVGGAVQYEYVRNEGE
jgi:hypothetical protein